MAHAAAVAHYTEMAREAANMAAMRAGQARFETAPELPDDDTLTADEAQSQAEDEMLTTTEAAADWIAKACDCEQGRAPINTLHIGALAILECTSVPVLLALILNGTAQQQAQAADRLAKLYRKAEAPWVAQRAAELLADAL